jgi:predicted TIM-barrel fold metal-dependent hydrolase
MMPRRDFLKNSVAGLSGASPLGSAEKPGFIDAHVHVWTNDFKKYPLAPGFTPKDMERPTYLPEDILREARPSGVERVVLIQMSYYAFDNSYMLDVIRSQPSVFRGVAIVDWNSRAPDEAMSQLAKQGVRGFRVYAGKIAPDDWLELEGLQKMFRRAAREHLSLCPLINPDALAALNRHCAKHPDTPVVVDHLARIGASSPTRKADIDELCALARHPNVKVKVSAFYALGEKKPPHLDLTLLIRRVYDAFGPKRLMWASDCPFQTLRESYEDSISLIRDRLDFVSADDKEWILRRTAEESFFR